MTKTAKRRLQQEANRLEQKYGNRVGSLASYDYKLDVIPTGVLALDYALGIGGWPLGHCVEIYGPPDIGKSSTLGLAAIGNAQRQGLTTGIIALEPGIDKNWLIKHGVDPALTVVARPRDGEEAFEILHEWITGDIVDFTLFDSIGAVARPSEVKDGGKQAKGGASGLITWGVRRICNPTWVNNKGLIFLNQVRDDMDAMYHRLDSPGGHALKHFCDIRIELKHSSGKDSYFTRKIHGDDVTVGNNITAIIQRNKMAEGTKQKAKFDYYQMTTEDTTVGIDVAADVVATGIRTGVITKHGSYYRHPSFPEMNSGEHQIQSKEKVGEYLAENPEVYATVRKDVLGVMFSKTGPVTHAAPDLNAIDKKVEADGEEGE